MLTEMVDIFFIVVQTYNFSCTWLYEYKILKRRFRITSNLSMSARRSGGLEISLGFLSGGKSNDTSASYWGFSVKHFFLPLYIVAREIPENG